MYTLLLNLQGPMQSWGTSSRFTERDSAMEPSKSGVIGLICAALGKPRQEDPEEHKQFPSLAALAALRMGVLVISPGKIGVDFQSAGGGKFGGRDYGVAKANRSKAETVLSSRYYLQDASFIVGLQSNDKELLLRLHSALANPVWPLFLGRKSFVPSTPPYIINGLRLGDIESVFLTHLKENSKSFEEPQRRRRVVYDDIAGREQRIDVPLDFSTRRFGVRYVSVGYMSPQNN